MVLYDLPATCSDGTSCVGNVCCSDAACPSAHPAFDSCGTSHADSLAQEQVDAAGRYAAQYAEQLGMEDVVAVASEAAGAAAAEAARERGENCTAQGTAAGWAAASSASNQTGKTQAALGAAAAARAAAGSGGYNGVFVSSSQCASTQGQIDAAARMAELIATQAGLTPAEVAQAVQDAIRAAEWEATHPSNRTSTFTSTSSTVTSTTTLPVVVCVEDEPNCSTYMQHTQRCQANCSSSDLLFGYETCIVTADGARYFGSSFCRIEGEPATAATPRDYVLGSVNVVVNGSTPLTAQQVREALVALMGIQAAQVQELNVTLVADAPGQASYTVDYIIKEWTLQETQQLDGSALSSPSAGEILGITFAVRSEESLAFF